jgi:hypothetical protein
MSDCVWVYLSSLSIVSPNMSLHVRTWNVWWIVLVPGLEVVILYTVMQIKKWWMNLSGFRSFLWLIMYETILNIFTNIESMLLHTSVFRKE